MINANYVFVKWDPENDTGKNLSEEPFRTVIDASIDLILVPREMYDMMDISGKYVKCADVGDYFYKIDIIADEQIYTFEPLDYLSVYKIDNEDYCYPVIWPINENLGFDIILGTPFLKKFHTEFDFENQELLIYQPVIEVAAYWQYMIEIWLILFIASGCGMFYSPEKFCCLCGLVMFFPWLFIIIYAAVYGLKFYYPIP